MNTSEVFVEHVAIYVQDIHWHISFFEEVFGMEIRKMDGELPSPKQLWFKNGIQLVSSPDSNEPSGKLAHIGIVAANMDTILEKACQMGAEVLPKGRNWLRLKDGLCLEILPIR